VASSKILQGAQADREGRSGQASERASTAGGWAHEQRAGERASKRSSVRGASKQAALNMIPIIHCEGRCFAVIKQKTLERGALIQLYTFEGRYLYEYKVPKVYPLVAAHIRELRQEAQEKYGINYQSHLQEMAILRDEARKLKQLSPAVTAEKNRGQVGGLYIDRQVNINANVDLSKLSPDELQDKLDKMYDEDIKDVTPDKSKLKASEVKQDPESD
jgi:hypothetical protein